MITMEVNLIPGAYIQIVKETWATDQVYNLNKVTDVVPLISLKFQKSPIQSRTWCKLTAEHVLQLVSVSTNTWIVRFRIEIES